MGSSISRAGVGTSVTTGELGDDAVTAVKIAEAAKAELLGPYKTVFQAGTVLEAAEAAGAYILGGSNNVTTVNSGADALPGAYLPLFRLQAADYAITGLNTRFRVTAIVGVNGTDSGTSNFTAGLYPVTVGGAADVMAQTLGTVVTNSTAQVAAASLTTSEFEFAASSDVAPPTDGVYALGVVTSAALAASSAVVVWAQLQVHHVT